MSRYPRPLQNRFDVPARRFLMKRAVEASRKNPNVTAWVLHGWNCWSSTEKLIAPAKLVV